MPNSPKPRLTHFALFCRDIEKMTDFYTRVMGLTVTDQGPHPDPEVDVDMVFLSADPEEHHQFVLVTGRPDDVNFALNQQMSFTLRNLDELREMYCRAGAENPGSVRQVCHGNAWSIYFNDPEGNRIELYVATPWHVPQPHGDALDLGQDNDRIISQTEAHCRADPGFMTAAERRAEMSRMMGLGH